MNINFLTNKKVKLQNTDMFMSPINEIIDDKERYKRLKSLLDWSVKYLINFMEIKKSLDNIYGDKWILTGSVAVILLLLNEQNIDILLKHEIRPSDIDILVNSLDNVNIKNINNYYRKQTGLERSVTFNFKENELINEDIMIKSIDVTNVNMFNYIIINGIRILDPNNLLSYYETDIKDNLRKDKNDEVKILLLREYLKLNQIKSIKMDAKTESKKKQEISSSRKLNYNILNKDTNNKILDKLENKLILNKDTEDKISKKLLFDDED